MFRVLYTIGFLVAIAAATLVLLPLFLFESASRLWKFIELHAVYGGDEKAQTKGEWQD